MHGLKTAQLPAQPPARGNFAVSRGLLQGCDAKTRWSILTRHRGGGRPVGKDKEHLFSVSGHAYARYVSIGWEKSRPGHGFPLVSPREPASSSVLFKLLFLFAACLLGWSLGREGGESSKGARSQGLRVRVVGLEEGGLLQGVGISIPQSWEDRLDLCCSCYLCKGEECFIFGISKPEGA